MKRGFGSGELGPFQEMARNLGLDGSIVRHLPLSWPSCSQDEGRIANALYEAGFPPGEDLLKTARLLWKYWPGYLR